MLSMYKVNKGVVVVVHVMVENTCHAVLSKMYLCEPCECAVYHR